ncbi:hypothetical protein D3P09_16605 [Paenibacillus pinisoli]|uniref:SLH domain-containing protein n=1 Tax=Paenibacillus pinisoli TaxID=1276110 RepID=A0A3A6PTN9_9BACL|nr:S-layer homology domain-containing protein [Paenibacillus pinisoli]RJX39113.1 hypothetical protein D3P09_16605 [Paenibacillus pinisoli]
MKAQRIMISILSMMSLFWLTGIYGITSEAYANGRTADQPSGWAANDVSYMIKAGLVPDGLQGNYTAKITRSEYASLVYPVVVQLVGGTNHMDHILNEHLFQDTINAEVYHVYKLGIVNGINDLEFKPARNIERKEAVVMMGNLMKSLRLEGLSYDKAPYVDYSVIPSWAAESANITYHAKIFQGTAAGMEPDKPYTREQSIVTMKRLLDFASEVKGVSYRGKVYADLDTIFDVRVGANYVKIGSKKSPKSALELWESVSHNFPNVAINGKTAESIRSNNFIIETLGADYLIKISW